MTHSTNTDKAVPTCVASLQSVSPVRGWSTDGRISLISKALRTASGTDNNCHTKRCDVSINSVSVSVQSFAYRTTEVVKGGTQHTLARRTCLALVVRIGRGAVHGILQSEKRFAGLHVGWGWRRESVRVTFDLTTGGV